MGLIAPTREDDVDNGAGWRLHVRLYDDPQTRVPGRRPIVLVPGYAMNTHILAYHPGGPSLVEHLVARGFEVWTANLRGQGGSRRVGPPRPWGLGELALDDLPRVFDHVLANTRTGATQLDPIGCSLGGSLLYAYLAHHPIDHPFGSVVSIGGPLRWETPHPVMRVMFASSRLAGAVHIRGTRRMAGFALPWMLRAPALLSVYMNAAEIDLTDAGMLLPTIDDPVPHINRQVARWVRNRDLVVRGREVTRAMRDVVGVRLLAILANRDGVVTPSAARAIVRALGPERVDVLEVGTPERWCAHADLFIGRRAQAEVFEPMARWLIAG